MNKEQIQADRDAWTKQVTDLDVVEVGSGGIPEEITTYKESGEGKEGGEESPPSLQNLPAEPAGGIEKRVDDLSSSFNELDQKIQYIAGLLEGKNRDEPPVVPKSILDEISDEELAKIDPREALRMGKQAAIDEINPQIKTLQDQVEQRKQENLMFAHIQQAANEEPDFIKYKDKVVQLAQKLPHATYGTNLNGPLVYYWLVRGWETCAKERQDRKKNDQGRPNPELKPQGPSGREGVGNFAQNRKTSMSELIQRNLDKYCGGI